jgi:endoglucanase
MNPCRALAVAVAAGAIAATLVALPLEPSPSAAEEGSGTATLRLNDLEYLEMPGLNVMLAHDYYPEGHQGGVGIIQNGLRVATNGDLRLDRTPGQWQPVPKVGQRVVDRATGEISLRAEYPDESRNRKGFNPIDYPDLAFGYTIRVRPEGRAFRILVDLEAPLPDEWIGRVGFNLELFPGILFGKTWTTETGSGIFPRQVGGPGRLDAAGQFQVERLGAGRRLSIAPESDRQRMVIEDVTGGGLELVDGRGQHSNGWFVVRSLVARGATKGAVDWRVTPHAIPGFLSDPVVQVSQVGYHPAQQKRAVIELDSRDERRFPVVLSRISEAGGLETVLQGAPEDWGPFLRYRYLRGCTWSATDRRGPTPSASPETSTAAACGSPPSSTSCPSRCATSASTTATGCGTGPATSTTRAWRPSTTTTSTATPRGLPP